jgi:dihydrofolate reductase
MNSTKPKIIIHMVSSLDGFIASKDGDISWMQSSDSYPKGISLSKSDITDFLQAIDCYVMGSRTYDLAQELGWPYGNKPVFVLTSKARPVKREHVEFYSGDLKELVHIHLKPKYDSIWMVGGSELTKAFINLKLADEIVISIIPLILGDGTLFFDSIGREHRLHLKDVKAYKDGMVELWYELKN